MDVVATKLSEVVVRAGASVLLKVLRGVVGFGLALPEEVETHETIETMGVQIAGTIDGVGLQRCMMVVELSMGISRLDPLDHEADTDTIGRIFELEEVDCEMVVETELLAGWAVDVSEESAFSISTRARGSIIAHGAETGSVQNSAIPPF